MKTKTLWKSMRAGLKSNNGDLGPWKLGKWRKHEGELEMCRSGFHASENVIDAMRYVSAEAIAEVEVRGKHLAQDDKQCWSEMRILRAWEWTKEDSVSLAIYAAELVIGIFESKYPDDKRPREAIEAAKAWLKDPSDKNRSAARSAAWSAAESAWSAAESAWSAARSAARSAWSAAESAAYKDIMDKCHAFVLARLEARGKK